MGTGGAIDAYACMRDVQGVADAYASVAARGGAIARAYEPGFGGGARDEASLERLQQLDAELGAAQARLDELLAQRLPAALRGLETELPGPRGLSVRPALEAACAQAEALQPLMRQLDHALAQTVAAVEADVELDLAVADWLAAGVPPAPSADGMAPPYGGGGGGGGGLSISAAEGVDLAFELVRLVGTDLGLAALAGLASDDEGTRERVDRATIGAAVAHAYASWEGRASYAQSPEPTWARIVVNVPAALGREDVDLLTGRTGLERPPVEIEPVGTSESPLTADGAVDLSQRVVRDGDQLIVTVPVNPAAHQLEQVGFDATAEPPDPFTQPPPADADAPEQPAHADAGAPGGVPDASAPDPFAAPEQPAHADAGAPGGVPDASAPDPFATLPPLPADKYEKPEEHDHDGFDVGGDAPPAPPPPEGRR